MSKKDNHNTIELITYYLNTTEKKYSINSMFKKKNIF